MLGKARRAWYYATGILALRRDDVILASFPKSGNTWVRFFLGNLISLVEGDGEQVDFQAVNRRLPELGVSNLFEPWPHSVVPRVVKTHKRRWPVFAGRPSVLLIRDPRDVMVSFYHFEQGKRRPRFQGEFSEFIRHPRFGLEAWLAHYRSWLPEAGMCLRYEELKEDDLESFRRLLRYLEVEVGEEVLEEAVARSRFKEVRKIEEAFGNKPGKYRSGYRFTRKGSRGDWKNHFGEQDLAYYRTLKERHALVVY